MNGIGRSPVRRFKRQPSTAPAQNSVAIVRRVNAGGNQLPSIQITASTHGAINGDLPASERARFSFLFLLRHCTRNSGYGLLRIATNVEQYR